jgi:hypothetical protein
MPGGTAINRRAAIGVKAIGANEYDVDLVAHVPDLDIAISPASLKKNIGDRLRSNGSYADLLEEMPRCWRLNYVNEFHLARLPDSVSSSGQD